MFANVVLLLAGCSIVQGLLGGDPAAAAAAADAKLAANDLAGASAAYDEALAKHPTDVAVVSGAAYLKLLKGDAAGADALLAAAEATAGERLSEVKLRRALLALEAEDLDKVKEFATASGLPAGKLLAAEVDLANGDRDPAKALLEEAKGAGGAVGETAGLYLALMADPNPLVAGLSEAQALWALGKRKIAVRSVEDLVGAYAESRDDGSEQLLIWAGRAASSGEPEVATRLLDAIVVAPTGQKWRVDATRAIVACAAGDGATCAAQLTALEAYAPADGLADAKVTAAAVLADKDAATAKGLLANVKTEAAARVLASMGDTALAMESADPLLKSQLGG